LGRKLQNIVAVNYFHRFMIGEELVRWVWFGSWIFSTALPADSQRATVNKHAYSARGLCACRGFQRVLLRQLATP